MDRKTIYSLACAAVQNGVDVLIDALIDFGDEECAEKVRSTGSPDVAIKKYYDPGAVPHRVLGWLVAPESLWRMAGFSVQWSSRGGHTASGDDMAGGVRDAALLRAVARCGRDADAAVVLGTALEILSASRR